MADLEVINHLKKAIHTLQQPERSLWEKVKELALEIFIIVFAVSLSIWLHSRTETRHEQAEVHYFLQELRQDLVYDLKEYEKSKRDYATKARVFSALIQPEPDTASANQIYDVIHDFDEPMPSLGRYESFKYSGKIGHIHTPKLAADIIRLFEEDARRLQYLTGDYIRLQNEFHDNMNKELAYTGQDDSESNIQEVVKKNIFRNLARDLRHTTAIQQGYTNCIQRIEKILTAINAEIGPEKEHH